MRDTITQPQHPYARRQKIVLLTAGVMIMLFYLFNSFPEARGNGIALSTALLVAGFGLYVVALAIGSSPRKRIALFTTPFLALLLATLVCLPNLRRARLQRQLESLGATVTSTADPGDGTWFRFYGMLLPNWLKTQLGDAFFGTIVKIDLSYRSIPVDSLAELGFAEPIDALDLRFSKTENDDLTRLTRLIDAKKVDLNSIPVDAATLDAFADMPSLVYIALIETDVSAIEASEFVAANPGIRVAYGDNKGSWSIVRPPITEP